MLMQMLAGGGAGGMPGGLPPGMGMSSEKLYSNYQLEFTHMQNHLWDAFNNEGIASNYEFMNALT